MWNIKISYTEVININGYEIGKVKNYFANAQLKVFIDLYIKYENFLYRNYSYEYSYIKYYIYKRVCKFILKL